MGNIRDLKKDINYVLGDIIDAIKEWQDEAGKEAATQGEALVDEAIAIFDELMAKVNDKSVENRKSHLKVVKQELETKANALIEKVNSLA